MIFFNQSFWFVFKKKEKEKNVSISQVEKNLKPKSDKIKTVKKLLSYITIQNKEGQAKKEKNKNFGFEFQP